MIEKPEKRFERLMEDQGMDKLRKTNREQFEELMKREGLENIARKEGYAFIVIGRDQDEKDFKVLAEFETPEEAEDWYNSFGQLVVEEGGEIRLQYGKPESARGNMYVVRYQDPNFPDKKPEIREVFDTPRARREWYEDNGKEAEKLFGGKFVFSEEPAEEVEKEFKE